MPEWNADKVLALALTAVAIAGVLGYGLRIYQDQLNANSQTSTQTAISGTPVTFTTVTDTVVNQTFNIGDYNLQVYSITYMPGENRTTIDFSYPYDFNFQQEIAANYGNCIPYNGLDYSTFGKLNLGPNATVDLTVVRSVIITGNQTTRVSCYVYANLVN